MPDNNRDSEEHILCRDCGYDLYGLANNARCPECGQLVSIARAGIDLRDASPEWLEHLRLGLTAAQAGAVLALFSLPVFIFCEFYCPIELGGAVWLLGVLTRLCGAWLLTKPDPRFASRRTNLLSVWWPRGVAIAETAACGAVVAGNCYGSLSFISIAGLVILAIITLTTLAVCIDRLGRRVAVQKIWQATRIAVFSVPASFAGLVFSVWWLSQDVLFAIASFALCISGVGVLITIGAVARSAEILKGELAWRKLNLKALGNHRPMSASHASPAHGANDRGQDSD